MTAEELVYHLKSLDPNAEINIFIDNIKGIPILAPVKCVALRGNSIDEQKFDIIVEVCNGVF